MDFDDLPPVIVCYKLNGEWLTPERGAPVRVVVPEHYGYKSVRTTVGGYWNRVEALGKDVNPNRLAVIQFVGVADTDAEAYRLYREPAEYFFNRSFHVYPGFTDPPGYVTEASVRAKVEGLGSAILGIAYVDDDPDAVETALGRFSRGVDTCDLVLTAGSASTDPRDAFYVAIEALGGRVVRHGVPSHPGSMLWLARVGGTAILGLPTCGAYSKATAADLLLPRLLSGEPASEKTVAKLGHGGILTRSQRFRFPPYARDLDAPDG